MKKIDVTEIVNKIDKMVMLYEEYQLSVADELHREIESDLELLVALVESKQAMIDKLMLEHCPEEMCDEQLQNWANHQVVSEGSVSV